MKTMETVVKGVLWERVAFALETIRPFLHADGGDVEMVEITEDMTLRLRLVGACRSCQMSSMTMKAGIEEAVKNVVPEIIKVEAVEN